ncbi:DNA polymerase III subunit epsilon [Calothrix sp. PCC 7716]|nr:DNA polymerase III subunit epsilon [Calothrix sp. PCC 7716]
MPDFTADKENSIQWAKSILHSGEWCILDSETTGLGINSQIIQVGIITDSGEEWQSFVKPTISISEEATEIHGITFEDVEEAPYFEQVFIDLWKIVKNRSVIIFNAENELKFIRQSMRARGIQIAFPTSDKRKCRIFSNGGSIHCAMQMYSQYMGEWNEQYGNYRWQKLPGGDHSALGDCKATLELIKKMAEDNI